MEMLKLYLEYWLLMFLEKIIISYIMALINFRLMLLIVSERIREFILILLMIGIFMILSALLLMELLH